MVTGSPSYMKAVEKLEEELEEKYRKRAEAEVAALKKEKAALQKENASLKNKIAALKKEYTKQKEIRDQRAKILRELESGLEKSKIEAEEK